MVTTVLPVCGVALLLCLSCGSIGAALAPSLSSLGRLLCGWCGFLGLGAIPWAAGLSAGTVRPLFWAFFAIGLVLTFRQRRWADLGAAVACTAVISALLLAPFLRFPGLLTYGVHGLDLWGYVITADWLQDHSIRQLPEIGTALMRFNWTWYVLSTRERPLIYESLACLGSATGLSPARAYLAYPVALLASLAAGVAREPRVFRMNSWSLALAPALLLAFHPLIVLPWVAGFFSGSITGLGIALAFAVAVLPGDRAQRELARALATLMTVFCAGLYSLKFLYVALALGCGPPLYNWILRLPGDRDGPDSAARTDWRRVGVWSAAALLALALVVLGRDQPVVIGPDQSPMAAAAQALGLFGGRSPFVWLGYELGRPDIRNAWANPVGLAAMLLTGTLLTLVSWERWRTTRDLMIPFLVSLCAALLIVSAHDELVMAKAMPVFGFAGLTLLAITSGELRHGWLGITAALICCLPAVRSAGQMQDLITAPLIACTEDNLADIHDGQDWRVLGYLHFREDQKDLDWDRFPRTYLAVTHFLPQPLQERLARKYHPPAH